MNKILFFIVLFACTGSTTSPKFFKKLKKSITKRLKESVYQTIPLADAIRKANQTKKDLNQEIDQVLEETKKILSESLQENNAEYLISNQEKIESIGISLVALLIKGEIKKNRKKEINKAIKKISQLQDAIDNIKRTKKL